jgi:site-specific recombinase XerD
MNDLASCLSAFLNEHLPRERGASPHTCQSYAYSFQILVKFAAERHRVRPSDLCLEHLGAATVLAFLDHLEAVRGCTARTRNARLAAIKSFFRFLEYRLPACLAQARQIHAIPMKRFDEALVAYLTVDEVQAVLDAPDPGTASGLRDRAILHLAYSCGLRVGELVGLRCDQFDRRQPPCIQVDGKGRRQRVLPLWKETAVAIRNWLAVRRADSDPELFLNAVGRALTRSGVEYILASHVAAAAKQQPSLNSKRVTPHVLRHTCAMHSLQATGDIRKAALWLGHASIRSTEIYLRADPTEKLEALAKLGAPILKKGRYKAPDKLIAMLNAAASPGNYAE